MKNKKLILPLFSCCIFIKTITSFSNKPNINSKAIIRKEILIILKNTHHFLEAFDTNISKNFEPKKKLKCFKNFLDTLIRGDIFFLNPVASTQSQKDIPTYKQIDSIDRFKAIKAQKLCSYLCNIRYLKFLEKFYITLESNPAESMDVHSNNQTFQKCLESIKSNFLTYVSKDQLYKLIFVLSPNYEYKKNIKNNKKICQCIIF